MRSFAKFVVALCFGLAAPFAQAAHTRAQLILAADTARPGDTVLAGIHLSMDPQWHTYWKNPGAAGIPTTIKWDLPAGVTAGEIEWPVPEKLPPDDLTTYVYTNEVVLLVPLKIASEVRTGPYELKAKVSWLECDQECVPGSAEVSASINVGAETKPSADADLIHAWQQRLPLSGRNLSIRAWWEKPVEPDLRPLVLEWNSSKAASETDFYPYGSDKFEVQGQVKRLPSDAGQIRLQKEVKKYEGDWPKQLSGLLIQKSGDEQLAYEATLTIASSAPAASGDLAPIGVASPANSPGIVQETLAQPLWKMLLYAFIGGLILNVMPCVLPVIALKILGFVGEARNNPRHVRILGLIYTLGVLVSFLALAGLVIGVKAAGHKAGWGMQFSNPEFLVGLIVLVTLVALNLFGLFEINPGSQVMGAAGALASKHGAPGAFFNGVLATVLATPCTAPFLGVALGFAFAQSAPLIVILFLAVGLGLALPYVVLSLQPAWLKFLPKPGPWMQRFKIAMGFPMLATAVWLFNLMPAYYGKRVLWLGLFLVIVALAAWIYGEFVQRGRARRGIALGVMLVLLVGGYAYAIEGQLDWRQPLPVASAEGPLQDNPNGVAWRRWSPAAVTKAQEEGRPVLVDFTADWCLTCQANKKFAIEIPSVRAKLKDLHVVALIGDYTRFPDDITAELNRYGRAGVPLVLVYPGKPGAQPIVLPELLTPDIVLAALDRAAEGGKS